MSKNGIQNMSKAELAALRAEDRLKGKNSYEIIWEYLKGELNVELTESQELIYTRLQQAWHFLTKGMVESEIVVLLQKQFEVSHETAYKDLRWTKRIFGDVRKSSKEGERIIVAQMAKEAYSLALEQDNLKEVNAAIKNLIKIHGLDKEDPDLPDFEKLEPSLYAIVLDDKIRELFLQFLSQGFVDISELMSQVTKDVGYEELPPDDRGADQ